MQEFFIRNYINKLSINDIDYFGRKHGIVLSDSELDIIYKQIKNDWRTIIYGNVELVFDGIRDKIDEDKLEKIKKLYLEFRGKYKNYL